MDGDEIHKKKKNKDGDDSILRATLGVLNWKRGSVWVSEQFC